MWKDSKIPFDSKEYARIIVANNCVNLLIEYIASEKDIECPEPNKNSNTYLYTLAFIAARYDNLLILKMLQENGAKLTLSNSMHILHPAIKYGSKKCVDYILTQCGVSCEVQLDKDSKITPVFLAVKTGNLRMLKLLYECGGKVNNVFDKDGMNPVDWAVKIRANHLVTEFFLKDRNNLQMENEVMRAVARYGNNELIDKIMTKKGKYILEYSNFEGENLLFEGI